MRQAMETVYILLEKDLSTDYIRIINVYETYQDAQEDADYLMDFNEERKSYKIEEKEMI
jgi:hypothetical protein